MMNIVMTGGTSGLGAHAVRIFRDLSDVRLILGTRGERPGTIPLDLTQLSTVRTFAQRVHQQLGRDQVDALVLNAGVWHPSIDGRTPDGFETTFAINHLSQYLLLRLLLPALAPGARVIFTSSGTHDPDRKTMVPPPHHANAHLLAHPDQDPQCDPTPRAAGGRAYAASKLCNVLTARAFAGHPLSRERGLVVVAWTPGPTPGTALFREGPWPMRVVLALLRSPLGLLFPGLNTPRRAGRVLADLALGRVAPPPDHVYGVVQRRRLVWCNPSKLARNDEIMRALWHDSAQLLDLPTWADDRQESLGRVQP